MNFKRLDSALLLGPFSFCFMEDDIMSKEIKSSYEVGVRIEEMTLKEEILAQARMLGCDLDGDCVEYCGVTFYVNILENKVFEY